VLVLDRTQRLLLRLLRRALCGLLSRRRERQLQRVLEGALVAVSLDLAAKLRLLGSPTPG